MDLPDDTVRLVSRRTALRAGLAGLAWAWAPAARAHSNAGRVLPPALLPKLALTLDDGQKTTLAALTKGRVTAIQLIFTRCRATCPIQGAVFGATLKELDKGPKDARLLSISIDAEADTPERLGEWLARYGADGRWRAARPSAEGVNTLLDFMKARANGPDRHTGQVYYVDRAGALRMRSVDFPPAVEIARALGELSDEDAQGAPR